MATTRPPINYIICYYNNAGTCFVYVGDTTSLGMTSPTFTQYTTSLTNIVTYSTYAAAKTKADAIDGTVTAFPLKVCRL